jgi:hypothetical protein
MNIGLFFWTRKITFLHPLVDLRFVFFIFLINFRQSKAIVVVSSLTIIKPLGSIVISAFFALDLGIFVRLLEI